MLFWQVSLNQYRDTRPWDVQTLVLYQVQSCFKRYLGHLIKNINFRLCFLIIWPFTNSNKETFSWSHKFKKTISKRHWLHSTTSFKHLKRATKCMSYTYIHFFAAQINYCIHLRTRWNRKLQKVQVMTATRFWMLIQLASLSCICTYQGRRKVWKSGRGGSSNVVGIICPPWLR